MRRLTYLSSREEIEYGNMVGSAIGALGYNGNGGLLPTAAYSEGRRLNVSLKEEATAVWWNPPMKAIGQLTGVMWLEGELHLPQELKATNKCMLFSIEVGNTYVLQCRCEFSLTFNSHSTSSNYFLSGHTSFSPH